MSCILSGCNCKWLNLTAYFISHWIKIKEKSVNSWHQIVLEVYLLHIRLIKGKISSLKYCFRWYHNFLIVVIQRRNINTIIAKSRRFYDQLLKTSPCTIRNLHFKHMHQEATMVSWVWLKMLLCYTGMRGIKRLVGLKFQFLSHILNQINRRSLEKT